MSTALEQAFGRHVDIAINHDRDAVEMHKVNHPQTRHYLADILEVCPKEATQGRPVGWLHLSPDCTDHSQAKGGQPRDRKIRALSWVGVRWAGQTLPDVISLENVVQILKWCRLIAKRDKVTGRVIKLSGGVAAPGERVPLHDQYLVPDPKRLGETWRKFVAALVRLGYVVEWRVLVAADFGAPTTRKRLFMIARRDGLPIVWPEPTHYKSPAKGQQRWRSAAECIDFSDLGTSIFSRKRPLADATMRRIALGMKKFVLDSADPFIVPLTHHGAPRAYPLTEPLRTVTAAHRGELALSSPVLVQAGYGEREGQAPRALDIGKPLGVVTAGGNKFALAAPVMIQASHGQGRPGGVQRWGSGAKAAQDPLGAITACGSDHAVATAYLAQMNGGFNETTGRDLRQPTTTITNAASQQQLVAASMVQLRNNCDAAGADDPLATISAQGGHHALMAAHLTALGENAVGSDARDPMQTVLAGAARYGLVQYNLSSDDEAGALRVAAFLIRYYGQGGQLGDVNDPFHTMTTKDRLALVTVFIQGSPYVIVDIKLRMLKPAELYRGQGFPANYIIDRGADGRLFSKSAQGRMCGNSVSPPPGAALVRANLPPEERWRMAA